MSELKKDDTVAIAPDAGVDGGGVGAEGPAAGKAKVRLVVKTDCSQGREKLVALNDGKLLITPWHPVRHAGRWVFPADIGSQCMRPCPAVYSILLDSGHRLQVGGVECVTLGHGIEQDAVAAHEYYGSLRVVRDLEGMPGFESGSLHFQHDPVARSDDGRIAGFQRQRLVPAKSGRKSLLCGGAAALSAFPPRALVQVPT